MSGRELMREQRNTATSSVDLEILRATLVAYTAELASVLTNAAPTFEVSQSREFAIAIADADGAVVAIDDPQQLGMMAWTTAHVAERFKFDLSDGDVILTNDPYTGGTRVQDVTLMTPLIIDGELIMHFAARVAIRDIGGQLGGSLYPAATEILAEGHPITPLKIQRNGRPVRDVLATVLLNGRRPEETRQTLEAVIAALELGQRRVTELVARHGITQIRAALNYAQHYSETLTRQAAARWRPGTYHGATRLDLDPSSGGPVNVRLTATVEEDCVTLDFSESDEQRAHFINSSAGTTSSCALSAVLAVIDDHVPANSGMLRVVRVITRPGTVTHPTSPSPVGWGRHHCGNEIIDTVMRTLQLAVGEPLSSLTVPRPVLLSRSSDDRGNQTDLGRWAVGGGCAQPGSDGWGPPALTARAELPSAEQWETGNDGWIESFELIEDSGGAGHWRGAPGMETVIGLPTERLYTLWTMTMGQRVSGIESAEAGRAGEISFLTDEEWRKAPQTTIEQEVSAAFLRIRMAGGGGFGSPTARERAAVIADLEDGLISSEVARNVYKLTSREIETADIPTVHSQEGSVDDD